ncbi:MAG TPA: EpsG family protein [Candidatus Paceibacterota bacterium]
MISIGSISTYWILKILLVIILSYCGYGIAYKQPKNFYVYAIIAALFYSLIEGLRWDRGMDYMHYYNDLLGRWETPNPEFLYKTIVYLLSGFMGLPYWCGFVTYSLLLISAFLMVLKVYPKAAFWGLPLFFLVTESSAENIIRQYLAISFMLFAYYAYLKQKKILTAVLLCCVPLIHMSGLIAVVVFVLLALLKVPLKKPWILLVIYLALFFLWDISYFKGITGYLSTINLGDNMKVQVYLDNSDRWFSNEGSISLVKYGKKYVDSASLTSILFTVLSQIIIIYYGFKAQLMDRKLQIAFYFTYIAILFNVIGGDIEMYSRFYDWYIYLMPFILGIAMYKVRMNQYEKYVVIVILLVHFFYGFLRSIGDIPYHGFAFIWDR